LLARWPGVTQVLSVFRVVIMLSTLVSYRPERILQISHCAWREPVASSWVYYRQMLTHLFGDSPTEAAWWSAVGQIFGAVATAVAVIVALWLPRRQRKRDDRERLAMLAAEAMAAVYDVRMALEAVRVRSRGLPAVASGISILSDLFKRSDDVTGQRAAALSRAVDLHRTANDFAWNAIAGPMERVSLVLTRVSLAGDEELRQAAHRLRNAVGSLMSASSASRRSWARASARVDRVVEEFRAVTISVTGVAKR
jgi:hypothetical protein